MVMENASVVPLFYKQEPALPSRVGDERHGDEAYLGMYDYLLMGSTK